ncbi:putative lipoprotein [Pseudomonas phage EM]|uniref:Lipoprotein n=1 Tax=Pseudomonas phage EM TaxID=2936914 RepID=A0AAE9HJ05_9CAUD|nr:putative lipoprotein [Pseudomonas phage EM]UPW35894.1 putative lipoprotein [Pseudomonas phage EM]
MRQKRFLSLLLGIAWTLLLQACSTGHSVPQYQTILIVPPEALTEEVKVYRVEQDTVKALARAYILNTNSAAMCNSQLQTIKLWTQEQRALHGK